jgi:hypothetical protein
MSNSRNVESFEKLLGICIGYGGTYKPEHLNLQVQNMNAMLINAQHVLREVSVAKTAYENASDIREVSFANMDKLCTRIIGALKASDALRQTVDNAKVSTRKIKGETASHRQPSESPSDGKPKTRVARGQDYASIVSHFEKLLQTLIAEPLYQPNETDLSVEGLTAKLDMLRQHNANVIEMQVRWFLARDRRNALLYKESGNLFKTAMIAKEYIKSAFGYQSEVYQQVGKLRFSKPTE